MRTIVFAALAVSACTLESPPTHWDLDMIELHRSGIDCASSPPAALVMTIDDPLRLPVVVGDPAWRCHVAADAAVCDRSIGVDIGTIALTAREDSATMNMAGTCTFEFVPR